MLAAFIIFNVLLYFSNAQSYFFIVGLSPVKPLYWYLLSLTVGTLFILFKKFEGKVPDIYYKLFIWSGLYVTMLTVSFIVISPADEYALQAYISLMEALLLMLMFVLLFRDRNIATYASYTVVVVVLFSVLMNYVDFFNLLGGKYKFSLVLGRAAGLYIDSNASAHELVVGMVLSVFVLPRKLRWWYCLVVATGVLLTFSRGGILLWMIAVVGLAWGNVFVLPRAVSVTTIGAGVILMVVSLAAGSWLGVLESVGIDKYLNSNTTARIGKSFLEQNDYSAKTRMYVAEKSMEMIMENPLLGWGIGTTTSPKTFISPHNMFLFMGIEFGIFGVLMLCWLIWLLWQANNERSRIVAILYTVGSLFSQNQLAQPPVMLAVALAIASINIYGERNAITETNTKA